MALDVLLENEARMRIYADFNALSGVEDAPASMIERLGTLRELHRLQVKLEEGATFTFWDESDGDEDMEIEGRVVYDAESSQWMAEFLWAGLRCSPRQDNNDGFGSFPCFRCRADLSEVMRSSGIERDSVCPSCGYGVLSPMEAPNRKDAEQNVPPKSARAGG